MKSNVTQWINPTLEEHKDLDMAPYYHSYGIFVFNSLS